MADPEIDTLISEVTKGIYDEKLQEAVAQKLNVALQTGERPARPDFSAAWRSAPNVMFDQNDPQPEPFEWGPRKWATEEAYDEDLARFLIDLACDRDAPEAQSRGLAGRALSEGTRRYARRLAAGLISPDCPPAQGLPDDMRRELEQIAARSDTSPLAPDTSSP